MFYGQLFIAANLSVAVMSRDDGGGDQVTSSDSRSCLHLPYTERFSNDKWSWSPSAATPNGNIPSFVMPTDKSPTLTVSYKHMHDGASQEPAVEKTITIQSWLSYQTNYHNQ